MSKVLDYNGLGHYDEKIKNYINEHGGAEEAIVIKQLPYTFTETEWSKVNKEGGWFIYSKLWPNDAVCSIYLYTQGNNSQVTFTALKPETTYSRATTPSYNIVKIQVNPNTRTTGQYLIGEQIPVAPSMPSGDGQWVLSNKHENGMNYNLFWQPFKEVEANPENPTQTLSSIKIGDVDYSVGGGGEPDAYIKSASVTDNTLTLVNKDDTTVQFTPQGGGTVAIDNKTIIKNTDDELETAIGGKYITQQVAGNKVCDVDSYYSNSGTETHITYTILQKLLQLDEQGVLKFLYISSGTTYIVPVTIDRSTSGTYVIDVIKNNLTTYRFTWAGDSSSWTCQYQCVGNFDYLSYGTKYFVEMEEQLVPSPIKDGRFIPIDTTTLEVDANNNVSTKLIKGGNGIIINKEPDSVNCGTDAIAIDANAAGSNSIAIGQDTSGSGCINIGTLNNYNLADSDSTVIGQNNSCYGREYINILGAYNITTSNDRYKTIIGNGAEKDSGCQFRYIVGINNTINQHKTGQAIDTDGNHYLCGDIYTNCTDYTTTSTGLNTPRCGGKKLATEEYVDTRIPAPPSADGEYNLHCSIINGVPTYTWKAEPANRDEVSY